MRDAAAGALGLDGVPELIRTLKRYNALLDDVAPFDETADA